MRITIIVNGISTQRELFEEEILPSLKALYDTRVLVTEGPDDAVTLARQAAEDHVDFIAAAGGDGTVNQVINGLLQSGRTLTELPVLIVIPLGTANDFARTLGTASLSNFMDILMNGELVECDAGVVEYVDGLIPKKHYFINEFDTGMGPAVVERIASLRKFTGRKLAYYVSILVTFFTFRPGWIQFKASGKESRHRVQTLAITNGKYFGNNLCIAPEASLTDHKFNMFLAEKVSVLDFIVNSQALLSGKYVSHPAVNYLSDLEQVEVAAEEKQAFELDGEWIGYLPVHLRVIPRAIRVMALKN